MTGKHLPDDFHAVTPYLIVQGADRLLDFLKQAFDAVELAHHRVTLPDGKVMNAAVRIGDSIVELGESSSEFPPRPGSLHLYVEDADAVYERARTAGATTLREPSDQFYGDREAGVVDAFGNHWYIATHLRDVAREELERHAASLNSRAADVPQ
jgi:PhnB protein